MTLGFDPALHGSGPQAELAGVATSQRAVILSDARTCGFAYDPRQTADQLRDQLRQLLPVGSRDVAVHTVQAMSIYAPGRVRLVRGGNGQPGCPRASRCR